MIDLNFNLDTGVVRLAQTTTIKPGGDVHVRITFSAAPARVDSLQVALGSDATPPGVLAFVDFDGFTEESATVWTAELDATDTRLAAFMSGKGVAQVNLEVTAIIEGETTIAPNVAITVQQKIVTGPTNSDGGPTWYTQAQVNALLAPLLPAPNQADINVSAAASTTLFTATGFALLARKIIAAAGAGAFSGVYALPVAGMVTGAIAEVNIELAASANPTVEIRNATTGGTLLATVTNPAPGAAAYWYGRFRFDGAAWHCVFRGFNS